MSGTPQTTDSESEPANATADLETRVRDALGSVIDPCSAAQGYEFSVVEMGLLDRIEIDDGDVTVHLRLTTPTCMMVDRFVKQIDEHVGPLDGVESVELETDDGLSWHAGMMTESAQEQRQQRLGTAMPGVDDGECATPDTSD